VVGFQHFACLRWMSWLAALKLTAVNQNPAGHSIQPSSEREPPGHSSQLAPQLLLPVPPGLPVHCAPLTIEEHTVMAKLGCVEHTVMPVKHRVVNNNRFLNCGMVCIGPAAFNCGDSKGVCTHRAPEGFGMTLSRGGHHGQSRGTRRRVERR